MSKFNCQQEYAQEKWKIVKRLSIHTKVYVTKPSPNILTCIMQISKLPIVFVSMKTPPPTLKKIIENLKMNKKLKTQKLSSWMID